MATNEANRSVLQFHFLAGRQYYHVSMLLIKVFELTLTMVTFRNRNIHKMLVYCFSCLLLQGDLPGLYLF